MHLRTAPLKSALAVTASLSALMALIPGAAAAQTVQTSQPAAAQGAAATGEEDVVVVTGSRIAVRENRAISPVRVITADEIRDTAGVDIDEILKLQNSFLPSNGATTNPTLLESHGASTLDMRGLGQNRTLVLVNGQRATPNGFRNSVDVNVIPSALIQRVETLTGGAAAVYGADAVAGVTNFILRESYDGIEVTGSYNQTQDGNAQNYTIGVTAGESFLDGRLNVMGHVSYTDRGRLRREDAEWAVPEVNDAGLFVQTFATSGGNFQRWASATAAPAAALAPILTYSASGQLNTGAGLTTQVDTFSRLEAFINPNDRTNYALFVNFELAPFATLYARGTYALINNESQQVPVRTNGNPAAQDILVRRTNPFITGNPTLSAAFATQWNLNAAGTAAGTDAMRLRVNKTLTELGPLTDITEREMQQVVVGVRGDITDTIRYDLSYVTGKTIERVVRNGWADLARFQQATNVVAGANGQAACFDPSGGCVPFNIFGPNAASQAAVDWVYGARDELFNKRNRHQDVLSLVVSGDTTGLFSLPGGPVGWVVGAEKREEWGSTVFGARASVRNHLHTQGARASATAEYDLTEFYGELRLPLLAELPLVQSFDLEVAYRYTDHSQAGDYDTNKIGFNWALNDSFRLRGSQQSVVRGANIGELFPGINPSPITGTGRPTDYCNDPARFGVPVALCTATGAPATGGYITNDVATGLPLINNAVALQGGRFNIQPESGDTTTYGFVFTPSFIPGLSVVVDYYKIVIDNAISTVTPIQNMELCYLVLRDANSTACRAITRSTTGANVGQVVQFDQQDTNITLLQTAGWDFSIYYNTRLPEGIPGDRINVSLTGGTSQEFIRLLNPVDNLFDCAGKFGGGACSDSGTGIRAIPAFRSLLSVAWTAGKLTLRGSWRYIGEVDALIGRVPEPQWRGVAPNNNLVQHIDAVDYFDIGATYYITDDLRATFTIRNLMDKTPPILGSAQQDANTLPNQYDIIGRQLGINLVWRMR